LALYLPRARSSDVSDVTPNPFKELNRFDEAREALKRAIALAKSVAEAQFIRRELDRLAIALCE
jgi:predicted RNA polymerase sigma factor